MKLFCRLGIILVMGSFGISKGNGMGQYHNEGKAFVKDFKNTTPTNNDLKNVAGYKGTNIEQAKYGEHDLKNKVSGFLSSSDEGKFLTESNNSRPRFDIDPTTHPLLTSANSAVNNPESNLDVTEVQGDEENSAIKKTTHTCLKGQSHFERKCHRTLVPQETGVKSENKEYTVNFSIKTFPFLYDQKLENKPDSVLNTIKPMKTIVDVCTKKKVDIDLSKLTKAHITKCHGDMTTVIYKNKNNYTKMSKYVEVKLTTTINTPTYELKWIDDCEVLEKSVDRGDCDYGEYQCVEGKKTKTINGVSLTADCWKEERSFRCHGTPKNTCQELDKKGCVQISSQCKSFEGKDCVEWEQTYECEEGSKKLKMTSLSGEKPFCLDGDCTDQSWAPNQDMADALLKLSIFQGIKKNMDPETKTVFGGKVGKCSRMVTGFKDCCQKNGWGVKIGLSSCKVKEKELAEHRKRDKCIRIGTYCAKRELGVCIEKKTSFCCYQSKLARIINEQGKKLLELSFGSPENPNCEGLTLDQLTKLDFSKIDLSELFEDVMKTIKIPNVDKVKEEVQKSMANKTYSINDKSKRITQGRSDDNF